MSKSLVKFLDNSLFPASIVILGKIIGILISSKIFNIQWSLKDYANSVFAVSSVVSQHDMIILTSYSDLIMFGIVAGFLAFEVVRALYFHDSHVKPSMVLKLGNLNLLGLIKSSYEIYHSLSAWWLFTALANVLVWVDVLEGNTYLLIGLFCTVVTIVLSALILQDAYAEIEHVKKHPGHYNWN